MPVEGSLFIARQVPELGAAVITGGHDLRAVGTETADLTPPVCPSREASSLPARSHCLTVPSLLAVTICVPSGLKTAEFTIRMPVEGSAFIARQIPDFALPSRLAVTICVPSGQTLAELTYHSYAL